MLGYYENGEPIFQHGERNSLYSRLLSMVADKEQPLSCGEVIGQTASLTEIEARAVRFIFDDLVDGGHFVHSFEHGVSLSDAGLQLREHVDSLQF